MNKFLDIELTDDNSRLFHLLLGFYADNCNELTELLENGWCVHSVYPDTALGEVSREESSKDKNQPFTSSTLILVKTNNFEQKIITFKKGGNEYRARNLKTQAILKDKLLGDSKAEVSRDEKFAQFLRRGYQPIGSLVEGSNGQTGWYMMYCQALLFQKTIIKEELLKEPTEDINIVSK